ncbi:MAG: UDP-N-acetylmuramate--L-alanine ligase [Holophagales bacterium]|nr:MAG: UDP-N-acetylmuramate--L-alanine ligase [Holophagales bacterium]
MMFHRFAGLRHAHFVGIGGAGMSGIAEVLLQYELAVSGCDLAASEATARLASLGARISLGHSPEHLDGVDLLVISSAVAAANPEVRAARERGITVVRRAEMLAELMRLKYGIAVAGTHGKTTTTSLAGTLLTEAGLDPTVIVGGRLRVSGTGARLGQSDYMVVEADEFDRSFLSLSPVVAVITTIDADHLDTYRDLAEIQDAFVTFASRVPFFGQIVACLDDPRVAEVLPRLANRRIVTYGLAEPADLRAVDLEALPTGTRFRVVHVQRGDLGEFLVPMPGLHNVRNALAAIGVALALGIEPPAIARALATFSGVHRRFERLGDLSGAEIIDDYAHHPTEVAATLAAARQVYPRRRIVAVFQPHLFSRTRDLAGDFGRVLLGADRAVVTDVYPSRESPIPGVTGELVVTAARAAGHPWVRYCPTRAEAEALVRAELEPGDVVLTLGAGDIVRLAQSLAASGAEVPS